LLVEAEGTVVLEITLKVVEVGDQDVELAVHVELALNPYIFHLLLFKFSIRSKLVIVNKFFWQIIWITLMISKCSKNQKDLDD
jgi:hypothetical protein